MTNTLDKILKKNQIKPHKSRVDDFEGWMREMCNIYLSNHDYMVAAYDRVSSPKESLPFVQEFNFK